MNSIPELADASARQRLTLLVGADMPPALTGLPGRVELARGLAQRHGLDAALALAAVAQRVAQGGSRFAFTDYLGRQLDTSGKQPQRIHQLIARLAPRTIITTAYDDLLERAFAQAGTPINRLVRGSDAAFADPRRPTLIKLYGDLHQRDTLIVTEDDHDGLWRSRDKEELLDAVRATLSRSTVLVIGHNLSDPDFKRLWREMLDRMGRFAAGAYAVSPGMPADEQRVWADRQVRVIDQEPLPFLEQLVAAMNATDAPVQPEDTTAPSPASYPLFKPSQQRSTMSNNDEHTQRILAIKRRRLGTLEEQASFYGPATEAHISMEIDQLRHEIAHLAGTDQPVAGPLVTPPLPASPPAPAPPAALPLTLRFASASDPTQIIWEADVLGRRSSTFTSPYDDTLLPLVVKALDAVQHPDHPLGGPQFEASEREQLQQHGLWADNRVVSDIHERVGRAVYTALVADPEGASALRTARDYATAQGQPLTYLLRFPPDAARLAALPWEVLWDERGAVLLSRGKQAAFVRYLDLDQALPPITPAGQRLRMLAIAPHAGIPDDIRAAERAARTAAWAAMQQDGLIEIEELQPATPSGLVDRIQSGPPIDIVHFYGHGRYTDGQGALLFDTPDGGTTWLSADRLAALLGDARLVLLHACQSAMVSDGGLLTGVAPALSAAGIPAVVAMQLTVRVSAATRFAAVVYRSLAHGVALQDAVSQARQALYVEESDGASWYVPTLTIRSRDTGPLRLVKNG